MYALNPSTTSTKPNHLTPNLLPCAIHHNGPIQTSSRYWSPKPTHAESETERTAYFRGRKLQGRAVRLPEGYTGMLVKKTDDVLSEEKKAKMPTAEELRAMEEGDDMDEDGEGMGLGKDEEVEVKMLEQTAEFDEMVVWGHEALPETDDVYVRGVEEWVGFAAAVSLRGGCATGERGN